MLRYFDSFDAKLRYAPLKFYLIQLLRLLRFSLLNSFIPKSQKLYDISNSGKSSSSSPQSSLSSGSLAPASSVSNSCANVEQLFSQMKLPELHMSPFREPRPIATSSTTTNVSRAAGQSRPPATSHMSHHSSKHASSKSGNIIKERCVFYCPLFNDENFHCRFSACALIYYTAG